MGACKTFLQILLKLFNFLLAVGGIAMVLLGLSMLNEWRKAQDTTLTASYQPASLAERVTLLTMVQPQDVGGKVFKPTVGDIAELPAPWFIYAVIGAGGIICLVTFTGAVAAEVNAACCLTTYQLGVALMLLIQGLLAAYLFFNKTWDSDIPDDPTGELEKLRELIEQNIDILKWFGLGILLIQLIVITLAMVLRAMNDSERFDIETRRRAEALLQQSREEFP
eukprot:TRINITY_DN32403_c0_g1_i1.p1 TRINITY_DN32403_c0_g1~~TRINITY_DN32403_c0_g1_i1.p1  ORF type:complete len:223 (-),score=38.18 TRINITY_DN32403_c0_g1_i1:693-1361(-)